MKRSVKVILVAVLSVISAACFLAACAGGKKELNSMFAENASEYVLSDDYAFGADDVKATKGSGKVVAITRPITINLNGYTLDLNNYTLEIGFEDQDKVVFKDGTIKNGSLIVDVPNGDIDFENTVLNDDVDYELKAATDTVKFSNAKLYGKGVIKSDTRVQVNQSELVEITLDGNAKLEANSGAKLGALTVSPNATGATVTVDRQAQINAMEIKAPIIAEVRGEVAALTVADGVSAGSNDFEIKIAESAVISKVELKSAASVDLKGTVSNLNVASTVITEGGNAFTITVEESANVSDIAICAKTKIEIKAKVVNVVIKESAAGSEIQLTGTSAQVENSVKIKAEDITVAADENVIESVKVVVADTVSDTVVLDMGETQVEREEVGLQEIDAIINQGHTHVWLLVSETDAGCETAGEKIEYCEACGETKSTAIPAKGHVWEQISITEPTATEDGEKVLKCRLCGEIRTEKIGTKIVFKGLDTIAELLGDGSYTIRLDNNDLTYKYASSYRTEEYTVNVRDTELVINCKDGCLTGSFECKANYDRTQKYTYDDGYNSEYNDASEITVKGKLDGDVVIIYATEDGENHYGYFPVEKILDEIVSALKRKIGFEDSAVSASAIEKIAESVQEKLNFGNGVFNVSELNVLSLFFDEEKDGANTRYTFSPDKVAITGEMTFEELIDMVFGNKQTETIYKQFRNLVVASLDKTVIEALFDFAAFASVNNFSETDIDVLLEILQEIYAEAGGGAVEIDLVAMFNAYKDVKVIDIIIANSTTDVIATMESDGNNEPVNVVEEKPTAEAIRARLESRLAVADAVAATTIADFLDYTLNLNEYQKAFIQEQLNGISLTFTLGAGNKLVDYAIGYRLGEISDGTSEGTEYIYATVSQTIGAKPQIALDVDFGNVKAYTEKLVNGDKLTVIFKGVQLELSATETENGYKFEFEGKNTEEGNANPHTEHDVINATVEIEKTENGIVITDVFTETGDYVRISQNAAITISKGEPKTSLIDVDTVDIEALKDFDIFERAYQEHYYDYDIGREYIGTSQLSLKMQRIVDGEGAHYELIETIEFFAKTEKEFTGASVIDGKQVYRGIYRIKEYKTVIAELNQLPALLITVEDDCDGCYKYRLNIDNLTVSSTLYKDVNFIENGDGTYTLVNIYNPSEAVKESYSLAYAYSYSGSYTVYYNSTTGEIQSDTCHDIVKTYKLRNGATDCYDGVEITETCTKCDYKRVYDDWGCRMEEINTESFTTDCNSNEYITEYVCPACGRVEFRNSLNNGYHSWNYYGSATILTHSAYEEEYAKVVNRYNGLSEEDKAEFIADYMRNYIDINELADKGLDTDGFYHGNVESRYCHDCGLKFSEYNWYTSKGTEDTCKEHTAIAVEYNGNQGHDSFNKTVEHVVAGHYTSYKYKYNDDISASLIDEALNILPEELRFDYAQVALREYKCLGCGLVSSRLFTFASAGKMAISDKVAQVHIAYENGIKKSDGYIVNVYGVDAAMNKARELGIDVADYNPVYGVIKYGYGYDGLGGDWVYMGDYSKFDVRTPSYDSYSNRLEVSIRTYTYGSYYSDYPGDIVYAEDNRTSINITYYDYDNCRQISSTIYNNGTVNTSEYEWHPNCAYEDETVYGEINGSCRNGYTYYRYHKRTCNVCNKVIDNNTYSGISYDHRGRNYMYGNVSGYLQYITDDVSALQGLNAYVNNGYYCSYCNTARELHLYLNADWTLEKDAVIKAEGIYIDANGHTIDLNGHTLKIYGEDGSYITLTDYEYDTSAENPKIAIVDSLKGTDNAGLLVIFNNSENKFREEYRRWIVERYGADYEEYLNYYGKIPSFEEWFDMYDHNRFEIDFGCIGIDCDYVVSESDDLSTIDAYIYALTDNGGVITEEWDDNTGENPTDFDGGTGFNDGEIINPVFDGGSFN